MTAILVERWWSALLAVSWQFTLLFAVIALAIWIAGTRLTPAVRHGVWLVLLLRLALPIGLEAPFGLAPRPREWFERILAPSASATTAVDLHRSDARPLAAADSGSTSQGDVGDASVVPKRVEPASMFGRSTPSATAAQRAIFSIWCAGVIAMAAFWFQRARRRPRARVVPLERLPEALRGAMCRAADELKLRRLPPVAIADDPALDIRIAGALRPRLLVPEMMAREWTSAELEPVLLHELEHVRRGDPSTRAVINLLQTLFFFHPLAWVAARRAAIERELACDDAAVRFAGRPRYVDALLRLAAARLDAPQDRFALAAGGGPAALRSRLARLLDEDYRPRASTPRAVLAGVGIALAIGAGASVYGERAAASDQPGTSEERRLGYLLLVREVFAVSSIDEVIEGRGKPLTGDYSRTGSIPASATEVKKMIDTPELRRFLTETPAPNLVFRLVVDPNGHVRDVRISDAPPASAVTKTVQSALRGLELQPVVRRADGRPVFFIADARVQLEPLPASRLALLRALVGGELEGEVVDLFAVRDPAGSAPNSFYAHPPYVPIVSRPAAPVGIAVGSDGIYSLSLTFDSGGRVRSVEPLAYQSTMEAFPRTDSDASPPEAVHRWLESFELELGHELVAEALRGVIDVEVREGGASIVTRAPATVDSLRAGVAEGYRLPADENLDLAPDQGSERRSLMYRFGNPTQARFVADGPTRMTVLIGEDGRPNYGGSAFGCGTVGDLLRTIGWTPDVVRGEAALLERELPADLILRQGLERSIPLPDLERTLRDRFGFGVDFVVSDEPRDTIVLRGSFGAIASETNTVAGAMPTIHLYADRRDDGGGGGGIGPAAVVLPRFLSVALGMPVIDETIGPSPIVHLTLHRSSRDTEHVDVVLRNLERETGLVTSIEQRPTQTLLVTASSGPSP